MPDLAAALELLEAMDYRHTFRRYEFFRPYPKQRDFFALGAACRERIFIAGNRVGKTESGAYEATLHATGLYPDDWPGRRFRHKTVGWVAGVSSSDVKRVAQLKLCGPPGVEAEWGTGMIPKDCLLDKAMGRGVTDAIDELQVQHFTGGKPDGVSRIVFKSYEQGRKTFQGDAIDWGWCDEEPEPTPIQQEVYPEFLTRLKGDGCMFVTYTPMYGPTPFTMRLTDGNPDRGKVTMSLEEIPPPELGGHFTAEEIAKRKAGYEAHEYEARVHGIPRLGEGAIFRTPDALIIEPAIHQVPLEWVKGWGIDFGGASETSHPFAAALCAWDRDADCVHVLHTIRMRGAISLVHATAMKGIAADVPVFWPRDGLNKDPHGGAPLKDGYAKHGLRMHSEHAHWPDKSLSTEAGITEWDEREKTGRLKFAAHLSEALEERRFYHRKDGLIVKIRDDILSAVRQFLMMKRFGKVVPLGGANTSRRNMPPPPADWDVFTGEPL